MTMHAQARPVGPDAPWGPDEAPQVRANALPHDSALIFHHLRKHHPVFQALSRRAWALFFAMGCFLRRNRLAYPSQATLAAFTGYSARSLHRATQELLAVRALLTWASRYADGRAAPLHYAYGPVALAGFDDVAAYYPRGPGPARAKRGVLPLAVVPAQAPKKAAIPAGIARAPSDTMASGPSDTVADKLRRRILIEPSFCEVPQTPAASPATTPPPAPLPETAAAPPEQEALYEVRDEDRATAKEALTLRALRKNPKQRTPAWWDKAVVELVAVRVAQTPGTADEKLDVQRLALAGAWIASRDQAPTVRFIWGEQEHFLEHVERGRKKAQSDAREAAYKATREAEAKGGGQPPPLLALAPSRGVETPSPTNTTAPVAAAAPIVAETPALTANEPRARRADAESHALAETRTLAQKRAAALQAAAALAASWGEGNPGTREGDASPDILAARFHAARHEVEAELAALKPGRMPPPPA